MTEYLSQEIMMPTEDVEALYTVLFCPKEGEKHPAVIIRTPYSPAPEKAPELNAFYETMVQAGYALVFQHTRGRGGSRGECHPYHEREDGLALLEFVRRQDFYNGEIFLLGGSYLSTVHLAYLADRPKDIKGAVLEIQTDRMFFRNYRNGCCYNWCNFPWWLGMLDRRFPEQNRGEGVYQRPYIDMMRRAVGEDVPDFRNNLLHNTYDEFWQSDSRTYASESIDFPVLFVEGWYDFYIDGMFDMWTRLSPETRARSAFLVGPWGHATHVDKNCEYPMFRGNPPADYSLRWFDAIRRGEAPDCLELGKVNYYLLGADEWKTRSYPAKTSAKRLYFSTQGKLTVEKSASGQCSYSYDPEKRLGCFPFHAIRKAHAPGSVEGVLSFVSGKFSVGTDFYGKIRFHLHINSDCDDTAFFARIYWTEGDEAYNLTETIAQVSTLCPDFRAGEGAILEMETPPIAFRVKEGCGVRVDIASDGGIYVPHANVRGHFALVTETRVAQNTLFCGESYVELPEVEENL